MTPAQLRAAIDASLGTVPFAPNLAYTEAVKADLKERLPNAVLDVYFCGSQFIVGARQSGVTAEVKVPLAFKV